jgi:dienelactone hydrolase
LPPLYVLDYVKADALLTNSEGKMEKFWVLGFCVLMIAVFVVTGSAQKQGLVTKEVTYKAAGTAMKGYLAYNASTERKRPAVLVVPEWWGLNDYAKMRARQLADLGYVAMAIDMYGNGKVVTTPDQAGQMSGSVGKDPGLVKVRFAAAMKELRAQPAVDTSRIAAIGYCFGGTVALNAAFMGFPLDGVVAFHPSLGGVVASQKVGTKMLVCNGAADPFNPPNVVQGFKTKVDSLGLDAKVIDFPNAKHAFTNPEADEAGKKFNIPIAYNKEADQKSWQDMKEFLNSVFEK